MLAQEEEFVFVVDDVPTSKVHHEWNNASP